MKKLLSSFLILCMSFSLIGCQKEEVTIRIATAASLKNCMEEIYQAYDHSNIHFEGVYDASGKLQVQIENGLEADLFISASPKEMNALVDEGFIKESKDLLGNTLVLITGKEENLSLEDASTIAIGDSESVPAGMYAKSVLGNNYDTYLSKYSYGMNVTEVLTWTEAQSVDLGFVYKSDTYNHSVRILEEYDVPIVYPMGMLTDSKEVKEFYEFLQSEKALEIFEKYGFKGV